MGTRGRQAGTQQPAAAGWLAGWAAGGWTPAGGLVPACLCRPLAAGQAGRGWRAGPEPRGQGAATRARDEPGAARQQPIVIPLVPNIWPAHPQLEAIEMQHRSAALRAAAARPAAHAAAAHAPRSLRQQCGCSRARCVARAELAPSGGAGESSSGRRGVLRGAAAAAAAALLASLPVRQAAADEAAAQLERQLPPAPAPAPALPKAYTRTMHKLVDALSASIEAEAGGAKEFEVRRKADPAKDLVREFVGKWQENAAVVGDVTHEEMKGALTELGRFYQANGPRARLSEDAKASVLAHLAAVKAALPEEEKSLLGF